MTLPNLDKLVAKCKALGYEPKASGKRLSKEDCVAILRQHHMPEGGLPYRELTPMLCFAEWNLKPSEAEEIWKSPNWVAQKKFNGCRLVLHFVKDVGVFAHSRTISVKTFRFQELTDQLLIKDHKPSFSATLDCEVIIEQPIDTRGYTAKGELTKTSLHSTTAVLHLAPEAAIKVQKDQHPLIFFPFDVTSWEGEDTRARTYAQRLRLLENVQNTIKLVPELDTYFRWEPVVRENKRDFLKRTLAEGGEGVILKNLSSTYEDSSSRSRSGWVKVKKRIEYDAFVTGFIRGEADTAWKNMVGAVEFSVIDEKTGALHPIAMCSNLTMEQRVKLTIYDAEKDEVQLLPAAYGKVAEVSGQDISARSLRLSHATIDRWRPKDGPDGKRKDQCTVSMDDLRSKADWVG